MEKFLYLKLGRGNCLAEYWLSNNNVLEKPAAAIYFGTTKTKEINKLVERVENGEISSTQAREEFRDMDFRSVYEFVQAGKNPESIWFVTIKSGTVYIYQPASEMFDMQEDEYDEYDRQIAERKIDSSRVKSSTGEFKNIPKVMFVKNVRRFKVSDVPHVLATLHCNQYLSRGTCRKIEQSREWGAIQAIKYCLGKPIEEPESEKELMSLLGPYELETLVFLILMNAGVFSPAWRGGTQPDIDIVGENLTHSTVNIGTNPQIVFEPADKKTFQVKRRARKPSPIADYTVTVDFRGKQNAKTLTSEWLIRLITAQPDTKEWLENSLRWFKSRVGLKSVFHSLS